jgi:multiple sugar transport system substrate-binding protein
MQRKRFVILILFSFFLLGPAGCKPAAPVTVTPPHQGIKLRVACPGDPSAAVFREHSRSWAAAEGAKVEVVTYPAKRGPDAVAQADIWVVRPADLPHWAAAGRLQPLPLFYTERDKTFRWGSLLPLYREQLLLWEQKPQALPLLGEAPLFCYRADLLAKAGKTPPASWGEVADLAEHFHAKGLDGKPGPSLPPLPADDADLLRLFYTVAAPHVRRAVPADAPQKASSNAELYSFTYDVATGKPLIASQGFVHALDLLQRLQACRPPQDSAKPAEAFLAGQAVFCLTDASWLLPFQDRKRSKVRDRFAIGPMPGADRVFDLRTGKEQKLKLANRIPYLGSGGWLAVVPRDAPHADAAFALLAGLCGPERSERIALEPRWGGGPTRTGQLGRERWDAFDLEPAQTRQLKEALRQTLLHPDMKNPVVCLRTPDQAAHEAALAAELRTALEKNTDPAKALAAVARRWQELDAARDRERGPGTHLAEYRLSLGLRPGAEKE